MNKTKESFHNEIVKEEPQKAEAEAEEEEAEEGEAVFLPNGVDVVEVKLEMLYMYL